MTQARFIGGPWDGVVIAINHVPEFYEVQEIEDIQPWDEPVLEAVEPVPFNTVRYTLYDNWPVKYLLEGLK